jgi:hypothetical protein
MFAHGGRIGPNQWGIAGETGRPEIIEGPARVYSPGDSHRATAAGCWGHRRFTPTSTSAARRSTNGSKPACGIVTVHFVNPTLRGCVSYVSGRSTGCQ